MKALKILGSRVLIALLLASVAVSLTVIFYCVERENKRTRANKADEEPHLPPKGPADPGAWHFVVSGDSRNCGDLVMPAIAAHSAKYFQPSFYWHLGDLRAIYKVDEDMAFADGESDGQKRACKDYLKEAWPDFTEHQIAPFGNTPFYVGIGNHEVIPPKK